MHPHPSWLYWLDTCNSTNTWAADHLDRLQNGDVIYTQHQTAGRGQHDRSWHSPPGVLTTSFIIDLPIAHLQGFSLSIGLALITAIEQQIPELQAQLQIKWPNDIWLHRKKLAGILCESRCRGDQARVIVGIGLNCTVDFAAAGFETSTIGYPISLHEVVDHIPEHLSLIQQIRHEIFIIVDQIIKLGFASLNPKLVHRDGLITRTITLQLEQKCLTGKGCGINHQGSLQLQTADGILHQINNGRVLSWD